MMFFSQEKMEPHILKQYTGEIAAKDHLDSKEQTLDNFTEVWDVQSRVSCDLNPMTLNSTQTFRLQLIIFGCFCFAEGDAKQ